MPKFRTSQTSVLIVGARDCQMVGDDAGTTVAYTGSIEFNGRVLRSPAQLREQWAERGEKWLKIADQRPQRIKAHYTARGTATAYVLGVQALDMAPNAEVAAKFMKASVMGAENAANALPPTDDRAAHGAQILISVARELLAELETTASVTWIGE